MNDPIKLHVVCGTTLLALALLGTTPAGAQKKPDGSKPAENRAQTAAPPTEGDNPNLHSHSQPLNGVDVTVRVLHGNSKAAQEAISEVFQEFRRIQRKLAVNGRVSELRSVNKHSDTEEVFLSRETYILVQRAMHLCKLTKGAFDPTVQSLSYLWNFSQRPFVRPLDDEITSRMRYVGCDKIALKPNRALVSKAPRLRLSLHELAPR